MGAAFKLPLNQSQTLGSTYFLGSGCCSAYGAATDTLDYNDYYTMIDSSISSIVSFDYSSNYVRWEVPFPVEYFYIRYPKLTNDASMLFFCTDSYIVGSNAELYCYIFYNLFVSSPNYTEFVLTSSSIHN